MNRSNIRCAIRVLRNWDAELIRGTSKIKFDISILMHHNHCGSIGCAIGYLGLSKAMHKRGFSMPSKHKFIIDSRETNDHHFAMAEFFELKDDEKQATLLAFAGYTKHRTPGEVADVLQGLLSGGLAGAKKAYDRLKEARHAPHS